MAEMLLFDGVEIKSLFRVLRAELIASQDGLTTSEIKSCYKTYFGKVKIYTFIFGNSQAFKWRTSRRALDQYF